MSIITLVDSIKQEVKQLKETIVVPDEVYHERVAVCKECTEYNADTYQCRECGCFVPFKAQVTRSQCPLRKW